MITAQHSHPCPQPPPANFDTTLITALLTVGLYLPTSIDGEFSRILAHVGFLLCFGLLCMLARRTGLVSFGIVALLLSVVPLLFLFTYTSGVHETAFVEIIGFGVLAFLFGIRLERAQASDRIFQIYAVVNLLNIVIAIMILAGSSGVDDFITAHYSALYPDLVPNMLALRKPVLTFATHSAAGFFFYIFFYTTYQTYRLRKNHIFLFFCIAYIFLMIALLSNSGLILAIIASAQLLLHFWKVSRHKLLWAYIVAAIVSIVASCQIAFHTFDPVINTLENTAELVDTIVAAPQSGFTSRLGPGGILAGDLDYLRQHPISPIGAGMPAGWTPVDMGIMNYFLRGSFILVIFAYGGLLYFLRRTLRSRADAYALFCCIVLFELAFETLTYFRMLYVLPFVVTYLNHLRPHHTSVSVGRTITSGKYRQSA